MRKFAIFYFMILFCNCNTQFPSGKYIKSHLKDIEDKIVINGQEDFNSFFSFYKVDSIFQKERSNFSQRLSKVYYNPQTGGTFDTLVALDMTKSWHFIYESMKGSLDLPIKSTEIDKDTAVVILNGSDTSTKQNIKWKFIRVNGKWNATQFTDLLGGEFALIP